MALEIVKNVVVYGVLVLLCGVMCTYLPILLRFQIVIGMYVSEMTTITLQMMAITITISAKIMMVITIIHQMDRSKFDGIHHHHPSLFISIYAILLRNRIIFLN